MDRRRLTRRLMTLLSAVAVAGGVHAEAAAPKSEAPTPSRSAAVEGFLLDVARCVETQRRGVAVAGLPQPLSTGLRPALADERLVFKDPAVKVWTGDGYGSHVVLAELAPGKCQVIADQLPVDATFQRVLDQLHGAGFQEEAAKPDRYWPIVHQLERVCKACRLTVRLEGSEPGGLEHPLRMLQGHAYRYSLLIATVERTPPLTAPEAKTCELIIPDIDRSMGQGTVQGVEDHEVSAARIVEVQRRAKGLIDPDYAETPRVVVRLDNGETRAVATLASMQLHPGDRVEVRGLVKNPALPCNYLPVRVGSILRRAP